MKKTNTNMLHLDSSGIRENIEYRIKLIFTSFEIRIFNLLVVLIAISLVEKFIGVTVSKAAVYTFYVWLITTVIFMIPFRKGTKMPRKYLDAIHFIYYFFSIPYATMAVHYMGGAEWLAIIVYFFDLVYANILMSRIKGAIITGFIMLSYFTLVFLGFKNILPQYHMFTPEAVMYNDPTYFLVTNVISIGVLFLLMSYSTGIFSNIKYDRERRILKTMNRFAIKSRQLEEMTRILRKKVAENKYIKRAAMGYVEKKEFELETAKKDLEKQIVKLRNTQKSMFLMIEDLNEMGAQLKDARDHLEDKVKQRSNDLLTISRKLHRSERLAFLGRLAGSLTHELRNPLAVLKNAVYYLKTRFTDDSDEKLVRYIDILDKEVKIIDVIIDDIMSFAKTKPPELEEMDAEYIVDSVLEAVDVPEFVEIIKEIKKTPKVNADIRQLLHALVNIVNNAIMAMSGSGILYFRIYKEDDHVCIEIEDTGPGIPQDQKDLIFEPLYSSKPKGTGLGLPIAKMMIENQDGKIEFESEEGKGTVFRIFLPAVNKKKERRKSEPKPE